MFEFIRNHKRLILFLLILMIFPPFVLVGIEGYGNFFSNTDDVVAKVAGKPITKPEWEKERYQQMQQLRRLYGSKLDPKIFEEPSTKQAVLENLILQRVLEEEAKKNTIIVPENTLRETIMEVPGLTTEGKFNNDTYKFLLAAQGSTPAIYEEQVRQDLSRKQLNAAVQNSAFVSKNLTKHLMDMNEQEWQIQELALPAIVYKSQVTLNDAVLKAYYDSHKNEFISPEQVKAQYLILDQAAIEAQTPVSGADIEAYYAANKKQYTVEEQRRASHILIALKKDATPAQASAAKAKAEKLLEQVRKNPADFGKLAKQNSEDPGSAARDGDLDFFGKEAMVKPFSDTAFQMKQGEISNLVKTDYGYHIIQLTGIKPGTVKSLPEVKDAITATLKKEEAAKKYREQSEILTSLAYEQPDSLNPVAEKLKLKIETVSGVTRQGDAAVALSAPYRYPKFLKALFSDEVIKNKNNTEAVEISPGKLIVGRVIEHKAAFIRPFEEVRAAVEKQVTQNEITKLAKQEGEKKLAALKLKDNEAGFSKIKTISRLKKEGIKEESFQAIIQAPSTTLPAYAGVMDSDQAYYIYRIVKISAPATPDTARREAEEKQIASALSQQETVAYLEALKQKAKVKIIDTSLIAGSNETSDQK